MPLAFTAAQVEAKLGLAAGTLDATELGYVVATVKEHLALVVHADHITTPPASVEEAGRMLAAQLWNWRHSPQGFSGTDELGAIRVLMRTDQRILQLITPYMITAGLFGPSANTA